jgi:4-amino-4-deoxy-L-arabinose transferase-like glycosyltransferase
MFAHKDCARSFGRRDAILLALIMLVGFARGMFWVVNVPFPYVIDEMQHYGYVVSVATGKGIPTVGSDLVPPEVTLLAKASPTYGFRQSPVSIDPADPAWGASAQQYEGIQPPLYYTLMAPVYLLTRSRGALFAAYATRVVTLLLSLTAVPLTAALAYELFPRRSRLWVAAPCLLVALQAVNSYGGYVTNDALILPMGAAVLATGARTWRRGPTLSDAVLTGMVSGLAFLTRASIAVLAPLVAAALVGGAIRHQASWERIVAWAGIATGVALALGLPWLVWTRLAYPGTSAVAEFNALIGPIVGQQPRTLAGVVEHLRESTQGWFDFQAFRPPVGAYTMGALWVCLGALLTGLVACWRKRDWRDALALLWLAASAPVAVAGMFVVIQVALGGIGGMTGRYLVFTLPPLAVLAAAGLHMTLGDRWAAVGMSVLVAVVLTSGARLDHAFMHLTYTHAATSEITPVVDQSWHDSWAVVPMVRVIPPCPVRSVTLTFPETAPPTVRISGAAVQLRETEPLLRGVYGTYALPKALGTPFSVQIPSGVVIGVSNSERTDALDLDATSKDPVIRLACGVEDPDGLRFQQLHTLANALPVRYGTMMAIPTGWAMAAWGAVIFLLGRLSWHR